ncbi:MAG: hypothetical protein OEW68_04660 [Gammaproteobacteria bacterium]|nr:hypothetical protein [Gammaproteobacteria bacterium]MDH4314113.1 hypothetical protein [Gammaproteobacteria bacterium]MDH5213155.1 hypothetical protein [Gammaproteobacteria bacterium]MDH5499769.1 hypothetical protein [Gammaproteobacteria bacterium]
MIPSSRDRNSLAVPAVLALPGAGGASTSCSKNREDPAFRDRDLCYVVCVGGADDDDARARFGRQIVSTIAAEGAAAVANDSLAGLNLERTRERAGTTTDKDVERVFGRRKDPLVGN